MILNKILGGEFEILFLIYCFLRYLYTHTYIIIVIDVIVVYSKRFTIALQFFTVVFAASVYKIGPSIGISLVILN